MNIEYPTDDVPATAEYVLDVLRDGFRFYAIERKEPEWALSFETPFSDFQNDFLDPIFDAAWTWRGQVKGLCDFFKVECRCSEWEYLFINPHDRNVSDVCKLISRKMVTRPAIRAWRHVSGDCLPAGTFLTIRSLLAERGIDVTRLTPSAPLGAIPFDDLVALFWRLTLIHPGRLSFPKSRESTSFYALTCISSCLLLCSIPFILPAAILIGQVNFFLGILCVVASLAFTVGGGWLLHRIQRPPFTKGVWSNLHTFRDLSYAFAGQQPRRRIQPSS